MLVQLAEEFGLSRHRCKLLNNEYFAALARIAWADGVLITDEMADFIDVANLLDISADALDAALDQPELAIVSVASAHFELHLGDLVALTGDISRPRFSLRPTLTPSRARRARPATTASRSWGRPLSPGWQGLSRYSDVKPVPHAAAV
ncbi:hypothetical protein E3T39_11245 [Cryobacterium suzukii]|uniref:Uncharacterized protein n=1 Tax=Cryobacterium suzukii TaxID=1259198 RepID=A0A4V3ISI2_9MICO|nr:hypothetical protein [Cryobacterium suzukii]TFD58934.1 hypothetical protein E3T39_11245 [Cryobacterium suzukii]